MVVARFPSLARTVIEDMHINIHITLAIGSVTGVEIGLLYCNHNPKAVGWYWLPSSALCYDRVGADFADGSYNVAYSKHFVTPCFDLLHLLYERNICFIHCFGKKVLFTPKRTEYVRIIYLA